MDHKMAKQMHVNDLAITLSNLLVDQKNNPIEYTIDELASFDMLRSVLSGLIPAEPKITGKKMVVAAELDLSIPLQRDQWFRSIGVNAILTQKVTVGETSDGEQGITGCVLRLNGEEVGRIASEDVFEATFFSGIVKAFAVWKEKGTKNADSDGVTSLGRLPGKQIKALFEADLPTSVIAQKIGREESAVVDWIQKNLLTA